MKSRALLSIVIGLSLGGLTAPSLQAKSAAKKPAAKVSNKKGAPLTAAKLVNDMKASVAYIVTKSEGVNTKSKQSSAYWLGLNSVIDGITALEEGMQKKNSGVLKGLEDIGRGLTQTSASWAMIRGAYPKSTAGRGISSLHTAYETYVEHFGPAVARYKKKAPLSAKEKASLAKSGKQLDSLFANMKKVYQKAKPKSYQERMLHDLVDMINKLDNVRNKGKGKLGYASYMYQWNRLQNTLWAYSEIISAIYPDFYSETWQILEEDISTMDTCFGDEEELWDDYYVAENWDIEEEEIEEYDDYYEETAVVEEIEEELNDDAQDKELAEADDIEENIGDDPDTLPEDEDLAEEIDEELDEDEVDGDGSLADEVGESYGDDDGDGVADEEDTDDDNDGVCDEQDTDDDCDGVCDTNDGDTEEEEAEEMAEDDDNGIAECVEGDYDGGGCGGGCDGGCSDGGCSGGCGGCCCAE